MSEVTKYIKMKSTLKIAYASQGNLGKPVIKIVQPIETINPTEYDEHVGSDDDRDRLIRHFLQSPQSVDLNDWFEVDTRFPIPLQLGSNQEPTHYITTIAPVLPDDLFNRFQSSILNRLIPYNSLLAINYAKDTTLHEDWKNPAFNPKSTGDEKPKDYEKYLKIQEFFNWLEETEWASWDEQQPNVS